MNTYEQPYLAETPTLHLLLFQLGSEYYAVPSASVREVLRYRSWTPVPGAPATLPGILSQRGVILPVIELRVLFGFAERPLTRAARLIVAHHADIEMALLVENVFDIIEPETDSLESPPAVSGAAHARMISGIVRYEGHPVALLNLETLVETLLDGN